MIKKLQTALTLLKAGKSVSNPEAWKKGQVAVSAVTAVIFAAIAAAGAWIGIEIQVDNESVDSVAAAIITIVPVVVGLFNTVATVISTNKIGLSDRGKHSGS